MQTTLNKLNVTVLCVTTYKPTHDIRLDLFIGIRCTWLLICGHWTLWTCFAVNSRQAYIFHHFYDVSSA